jgi:hypothetical protein
LEKRLRRGRYPPEYVCIPVDLFSSALSKAGRRKLDVTRVNALDALSGEAATPTTSLTFFFLTLREPHLVKAATLILERKTMTESESSLESHTPPRRKEVEG